MVTILQPARGILLLLAGAAASVGAAEADRGTQHTVSQLEKQLVTLRESYALARADADRARTQLREIRARLEALGGVSLSDSQERLIDTAAQLEATRQENEQMRRAALHLTAAVNAYLNAPQQDDASTRRELEAALRDQELAMGMRMAPQDFLSGTPDDAQVLSIDSESGLIVINAGRDAKVRVGMPMQITRGDQIIANAIVTDVRKKVAGLLVQQHLNRRLSISVGDQVSVITNN